MHRHLLAPLVCLIVVGSLALASVPTSTAVLVGFSAGTSPSASRTTEPTATSRQARRPNYMVVRVVTPGKKTSPSKAEIRRDLNQVTAWFHEISGGKAQRATVSFKTIKVPAKRLTCRSWKHDPSGLTAELVDEAGGRLPHRQQDINFVVNHCGAATQDSVSHSISMSMWAKPQLVGAIGQQAYEMPFSGSYNCDNQGTPTVFTGTCDVDWFGDPFSAMGGDRRWPPTLNAADLAAAKWLPKSAIATVQTSSTQTLVPLYSSDSGKHAMRVRLRNPDTAQGDLSSWLWVELRTSVGFDRGFTDSGSYGVQLRLDHVSDGSFGHDGTGLVRAGAETSPGEAPYVLGVGQTVKTRDGVEISLLSQTDDAAVVQVTSP